MPRAAVFFRFLYGLETMELESGSEARVGVMLCVVHTAAEYVGQMECLLSILGGMLECGMSLLLMGGSGMIGGGKC